MCSLKALKESEGWANVTVVDCDMREWKAPEEADILFWCLIELLGCCVVDWWVGFLCLWSCILELGDEIVPFECTKI